MKSIRSYNKLVTEILNTQTPFKIDILDYVQYDKIYPILSFKQITKLANKTAIIVSGQHGDEPFAITTVLAWMKQINLNDFQDYNIFVYPIVNPFGYEKNVRDNGKRQDTNNDLHFCKDSPVKELSILYEDFPKNADIFIDIHGDTGKSAVYCYEHKAENLASLAQPTLLITDSLIPYLKTKTIYKTSLKNGVLIPPKEDIGIEGFLEKMGIKYSITIELPGKLNGQKRLIGGIEIINNLLKRFDIIQ